MSSTRSSHRQGHVEVASAHHASVGAQDFALHAAAADLAEVANQLLTTLIHETRRGVGLREPAHGPGADVRWLKPLALLSLALTHHVRRETAPDATKLASFADELRSLLDGSHRDRECVARYMLERSNACVATVHDRAMALCRRMSAVAGRSGDLASTHWNLR
jgi:hypothetical protein